MPPSDSLSHNREMKQGFEEIERPGCKYVGENTQQHQGLTVQGPVTTAMSLWLEEPTDLYHEFWSSERALSERQEIIFSADQGTTGIQDSSNEKRGKCDRPKCPFPS